MRAGGVGDFGSKKKIKIVRDGKNTDFRFSSIVLGVAESTPFQMKEAR